MLRSARAPVCATWRYRRSVHRFGRETSGCAVFCSRYWYCLIRLFLGRCKISTTRLDGLEPGDDRQAADELGDEAYLTRVFRLGEAQQLSCGCSVRLRGCGNRSPADRGAWTTTFSSPAKLRRRRKDVCRVDLQEVVRWVCLRPPWGGGTLATVPLEDLGAAPADTASPETSRVMLGFSDLRLICRSSRCR